MAENTKSSGLFDIDGMDPFYLILMFAFNIDGIISEEEKRRLSNFLRLSSKAGEGEDLFEKVMSIRPPNARETVQYLNEIDEPAMRFYYMLQVFALVCGQETEDSSEADVLIGIANQIDIGDDGVKLLHDIFIEENYKNPNILFLGSDSKICDIVKSKEAHKAFVVNFREKYFVFATDGSVLMNVNRSVVFDYVVFRYDVDDTLFIGNERLKFPDIAFRYELKKNDMQVFFSIVKQDSEDGLRYMLIPDDVEDSIGRFFLNGCHIIIYNEPSPETISIGEYSIGQNIYTGCIDDKIVVENRFIFDLSKDLPSLILSNTIASKIISNKEITAGNSNNFDIYIPIEHKNKELVKIIFEHRQSGAWVLNKKRANVGLKIDGMSVVDDECLIKSGSIVEVNGLHDIIFDPDNDNIRLIERKIFSVKADNIVFRYGKKIALNKISFENKAKDMVCIMGPSGCGKSTLIQTLAGFQSPENENSLLINNHPYYENKENFENYIGYVPQDDLLFENLSVEENLFYYGKLKSPDISSKELKQRIEAVLSDLRLLEMKDTIVGSPEKRVLSGGERRRLNIALELVNDCDILILDEPTSGLSSFDTIKIIELLSYISSQGKIIYVVIHQPSTAVFEKFSHLLLLDKGGCLAYFGKTTRAYEYFSKYSMTGSSRNINTPDEILEVLEAVRSTSDGDVIYEYDKKGNKVPMRIKTPEQWKTEYIERRKEFAAVMESRSGTDENLLPKPYEKSFGADFIQFGVLFMRNIKNKFRDSSSTLFSFLIPILLSSFLSVVLRYQEGTREYDYTANININKFLFLTGVILVFLAVSASINEVIKDRLFLNKEKLIGYSSISYVLSKMGTLSIINFYQVFIYSAVSFYILGIPIFINFHGNIFFGTFALFLLLGFILSLSSSALGLFVSSFLKSEKAAFLAVPLIIIPQIIFGGMFLNFYELKMLNFGNEKDPMPLVCELTHARWAYEGYLNILRFHNPAKHEPFKTAEFREKYGDFKNDTLIKPFFTYHESEATDKVIRKQETALRRESITRFGDVVRKIENDEMNIFEYWAFKERNGVNHFPYPKKVFYPFVLDSLSFALAELSVYLLVLLVLCSLKIGIDLRSRT